MKATTWLFPVLTLLCATRLVCTAQRGTAGKFNAISRYPMDYGVPNMQVQDNYLLAKRNKPSLSIVNPLDVLRQRLLLEIARRQMKENTRQVELNRAILKNVGKRIAPAYERYQMSLVKPQLGSLQPQQPHHHPLLLLNQHYPVPMDYVPQATILDALLQRPMFYNGIATTNDEGDDDNDDVDDVDDSNALDDVAVEVDDGGVEKKSLDGMAAANKYPINGNDIETETANRKERFVSAGSVGAAGGVATTVTVQPMTNGKQQQQQQQIPDGAANDCDELNDGYQLRYLYRLHKNHPTKM